MFVPVFRLPRVNSCLFFFLLSVSLQGLAQPPASFIADNTSLAMPYGVAVNSLGEVYVSDSGNNRLLVFGADGRLKNRLEHSGSEPGELASLGFGGLAMNAADELYMVDNGNHRIQVFDARLGFLRDWGSEGEAPGQFMRAIGITVGPAGNVYVTDDGSPWVQKFSPQGELLLRFGGPGSEPGQFSHATGIAVSDDGDIFVADYELRRVQRFTPEGEFRSEWSPPDTADGHGIPEALYVSGDRLLVGDYRLGQLDVLEVREDGSLRHEATLTRELLRPTGISRMPDGRLLVVNQYSGQLMVIQP